VRATLLEVEVIHRAEGLHMVLDGLATNHFTVKTARHKVRAPILFEQTTFVHVDTCLPRHEVVTLR